MVTTTEDLSSAPVAPDPGRGEGAAAPGPFRRSLPWLLSVGGGLGLLASADLNIERTRLLEDPDYTPSCSFNVLLDCGAVASSDQASVLGFSNTIIGVGAFAAVIALGAVLLSGGAVGRAVWAALSAGLAVGVLFVHWLIDTSVFTLGTLCPWCMVVWSVTIPLFWYVTLRNVAAGVFGRAAQRSPVTAALVSFHWVPVVLWFTGVAALIGIRFADSWAAML